MIMNLEFYNCPKAQDFGGVKLPESPEFISYEPDFDLVMQQAQKYKKYDDIIVLAHGGSITSFYGFYHSLKYQAKKRAHFLSTVDPDYIDDLKERLSPKTTLIIAISKSGETTTLIEMLMQFLNYPLLIITAKNSPLREVGQRLKAPIINHPPIGGRFTGLTEVALLPAAIVGLDFEGLYQGARHFYDFYKNDNAAWRAASVFWQLEQQGYVDVFMPFYARNLFPLSNLIVQLCHESFGKNGLGQTYLASEAPESQHHTNQRFFGGRKNISGMFISSDSVLRPTVNIYPPAVHSVQIKGRVLFDINKIPLEKSLEFELEGTLEDARIHGIPLAHLSIDGFSSSEIGRLTAFWQLYAVYSSVLRGVNPFDQPQVENSKNISFNKRLAFKGLL